MKTGTSRIVWGAILAVLFGVVTFRNLFLIPIAFAAAGPTAYAFGSLVGALIAAGVLLLGIRLLLRGLRLRRDLRVAISRARA